MSYLYMWHGKLAVGGYLDVYACVVRMCVYIYIRTHIPTHKSVCVFVLSVYMCVRMRARVACVCVCVHVRIYRSDRPSVVSQYGPMGRPGFHAKRWRGHAKRWGGSSNVCGRHGGWVAILRPACHGRNHQKEWNKCAAQCGGAHVAQRVTGRPWVRQKKSCQRSVD